MNPKKNKVVIITLIGMVFSVLFFDVGSRESMYAILFLLAFLTFYLRREITEKSFEEGFYDKITDMSETQSLEANEKKYLIFHILTRLEEQESINLEDLAGELDFPIYSLNSLVEWMDNHKIVTLTYPPMKNLPVIKITNKIKARKLRKQLYEALTPRDLLGNPLKKEFVHEISDFLNKHRRGL